MPGATFAGRYTVLSVLGQGGMGEVYHVLDKEIGEEIALKLLRPHISADPQLIDRFRNELRFARRISHPNVCRVFHLGDHEGVYYITMELVAGEDLKTRIARSGPLEPRETLSVARQVCEGLAAAHHSEVIHRDLKPQNIMIGPQGHAQVMDFGIARHLGAPGFTRTGVMLGTPEYSAPEQIDGEGVDVRSDIYAMGAILFEMTTGRPPFQGATALSVAVQHQISEPPDPRSLDDGIPDGLAVLILRCLSKEKDRRPQTAEELLDALGGLEMAPRQTAGVDVSLADSGSTRRAVLDTGTEPISRPGTVDPGLSGRTDAARDPFVAREEELDRLNGLLADALAGRGQVAFLTGDAGTGKTALLTAFAREAEKTHPNLVAAKGKCDAHTGAGDPYTPFREILGLLTGETEALQEASALGLDVPRRVGTLVPRAVRSVLEVGSDLVSTLVSGTGLLERGQTRDPGADWVTELQALVQRKRAVPADSTLQQSSLLEQITRVLQSIARDTPLLLLVDDLHWADHGSLNAFFHLSRRIADNRILLLGTYRPAEVALGREGQRHPLDPLLNELRRDFGDLTLSLDRPEDRLFFDAFLDGRPNRFSDTIRETLFRHTRGHPLFTVELVRSMRQRGLLTRTPEGDWVEAPVIDWDELPARVDAVVGERVARLPDELREILRSAAVEGEEFTAEVAARVCSLSPGEVVRLLSTELERRHHLVQARGMARVDGTRVSRYAFQHILFQRHLYEELDDVERPFLHDAVGQALEALYGDSCGDVSVQLARHFQEAGVADKAVEYLHQAGARAVRVSANEEAIAHFQRALALVDTLPEGPERNTKELSLQLAVAVPLQWARGFAAPELARATARARALCGAVQDPGRNFAALAQLALFHATRPDYRLALELVEDLSGLAAGSGDPSLTIVPDFMRCWPQLNLGDFAGAAESSQRAMAVYVPAQAHATAYVYGFELGVLSLAFGSWAQWFLGQPDTARRNMERALALARDVGHPHTLAFCLVGACELHWFLREPRSVWTYTEELAPLAAEKGFVYWEAHARFYQGERRMAEGEVDAGLAQMREAIARMRATGTETCLSRLLTRMADACQRAGRYDDAEAATREAMKNMEAHEELYMEAEMQRHLGEIALLRDQDAAGAEAHFEEAVRIARNQQARSLELRATMSLARLWKEQGKEPEARDRLGEVYGSFTEGLDTTDLVEARELLQALAEQSKTLGAR
ncbi:MAG: protein kinase [Gemmatimonadota bacterium]